jgi:hypothetical protein
MPLTTTGGCPACHARWADAGKFWSVIDVHGHLEVRELSRDERGSPLPLPVCPFCGRKTRPAGEATVEEVSSKTPPLQE